MNKKNNYNVKELMVGTLGSINYVSPDEVYWSKKKTMPYIVYEIYDDDKIKGVYKAKDIITNDTYYFYNQKFKRDKVLKESHNTYAINNNLPFSMFTDKETISLWEIKKKICMLNIDCTPLKYSNDPILIIIKECFDKAEKLDSYNRENIIDKLTFLAEIYIDTITYSNRQLEEIRQNASVEILETLEEIKRLTKETKKKIKYFTK